MLKLIICFLVCTVKFSFSLKKDNIRVCDLTRGGKTELRCCQGYRLASNSQDCIDCPNGTYGVNCKDECSDNFYGLRCNYVCRCFANETCNKAVGCVGKNYVNYESSITTDNVITSVIIVTVVAVLGATAFVVSWKCRQRLKSTNPFNYLLKKMIDLWNAKIIGLDYIEEIFGKHPVFVRSRQKSTIDIEDDDPYSEIRESMMVRPMTVYGRKLSIRSSLIDYDDPEDQYHRIELATSLRRPNLNNSTNEYTDYTEPIDEPLLQPKNNIYEQLIIDESIETQRNSENAMYADVVENHNEKHLNTTEHSEKNNLVTEIDNTEDKDYNCTKRETIEYPMLMALNTSEISNKTDVGKEIKDNTTYAKVVKKDKNECLSKINPNEKVEISENSTKPKVPTTDNEGEMATEGEHKRKNSTVQCEEDNSNKNVGLNKIMSDYGDTPVVISVSVGKQTIFIDLKDCNVLNSLSNDGTLENAITSVQMSTNVTKK